MELGYKPKALREKPELHGELGFIMRDFRMLSRSRTAGAYSINPIMINDIISYYNSIDTDYDLHDYIKIIQAADSEMLKQVDCK